MMSMNASQETAKITEGKAVGESKVVKQQINITYAQRREIWKLLDDGAKKQVVGKKFGSSESLVRGIYSKKEQGHITQACLTLK